MKLAINLALLAALAAFLGCDSLPKLPSMDPKKLAWDKTVKPQIVKQCKSVGVKKKKQTNKINDGVYLYVLGNDAAGGLAKVKEGLASGGKDATEEFKAKLGGLKTVVSAVPGADDSAGAKLDELAEAL